MSAVTKTTLNYPHEFRPVPQFLLDVPEDWQVVEYPGALFCVASTNPDEPWINVIVAHERIVAGGDDAAFNKRTAELAEELDDFVVEVDQRIQLKGDDDFYSVRQAAYTDDGVLIRHFEASTLAANTLGGPINDLFRLTFISPREGFEDRGDLILDILRSFRFA